VEQQDLFPKVFQLLDEAGLTARNKSQLVLFYNTLVSVSFIEVLLQEFDELPVKGHPRDQNLYSSSPVTSKYCETEETQQPENQRKIFEEKYPGWFKQSCVFLLYVQSPSSSLLSFAPLALVPHLPLSFNQNYR
jgi:hypothetical protein